jgi:hypothetical protein
MPITASKWQNHRNFPLSRQIQPIPGGFSGIAEIPIIPPKRPNFEYSWQSSKTVLTALPADLIFGA